MFGPAKNDGTLAGDSKNCKTLEDCNSEITALESKVQAEQNLAEALRSKLSKAVSRKIWIITLAAAAIGTFVIPILMTIIFGIVAYFIAYKLIGVPDLTVHQEENNIAAEEYIREHVVPIQAKLAELTAIKEETMYNGKRDWAIEDRKSVV